MTNQSTDECKVCGGSLACWEHCQESPTGGHEPSPVSADLHREGNTLYIDISCRHCGQSGCVVRINDVTLEEIDW